MLFFSIGSLVIGKPLIFWAGIAIAALAVRWWTKDYITLSIAIGGFVTAGSTLFVSNPLFQLLVFAVVTVFFIASFIPAVIKKATEHPKDSQGATFPEHRRRAQVVQTIDNMKAQGIINLDGKEYKARSARGSIKPAGSTVIVVDHDKDILIVH